MNNLIKKINKVFLIKITEQSSKLDTFCLFIMNIVLYFVLILILSHWIFGIHDFMQYLLTSFMIYFAFGSLHNIEGAKSDKKAKEEKEKNANK